MHKERDGCEDQVRQDYVKIQLFEDTFIDKEVTIDVKNIVNKLI